MTCRKHCNSSSRSRILVTMASLFIAGTLGTGHVYADTYMWVDGNGVVNYAERMPRNVEASRVTRISDNNVTGSSASNSGNDSQINAPQNSATDEENLSDSQQQMLAELQSAEAERQAKIAAVRKDNCERSRRLLDNLSSVSRVRVVADDGSESVMREEDRIARIEQAQRGIATNCT